ncbi:hypothetical protein IMAU10228_00833 [Lactiplantibacillus plantarum]|nr:hypothetical protein [Lactiplantibacillus plantarum]
MQVKTDGEGLITGYVTIGGIENGIDYSGSIPDEFSTDFMPGKWRLDNGNIVKNASYTPDSDTDTSTEATSQQTFNANILLQLAELKAANSSKSEAS